LRSADHCRGGDGSLRVSTISQRLARQLHARRTRAPRTRRLDIRLRLGDAVVRGLDHDEVGVGRQRQREVGSSIFGSSTFGASTRYLGA
jgi:hypothetical protein